MTRLSSSPLDSWDWPPSIGPFTIIRALAQRWRWRAVKNSVAPPRVAGLLHALQPTYAVLRPNEFGDLMRRFPETAAKYELAARMRAAPGLTLRNMGYSYRVIDNDFRILRRTRDFEQVVHPVSRTPASGSQPSR